MYARIITTQISPSHTDEAIQLWADSITPNLKQSKGFKGAYQMGDRTSGKGVVITLWESEADATAVDTSGQYQQLIAPFANMLLTPPSREQFEVFVKV